MKSNRLDVIQTDICDWFPDYGRLDKAADIIERATKELEALHAKCLSRDAQDAIGEVLDQMPDPRPLGDVVITFDEEVVS